MTSRAFHDFFFRHCTREVAPSVVAVAYLLYRERQLSVERMRDAVVRCNGMDYVNPFGFLWSIQQQSIQTTLPYITVYRFSRLITQKIVRDYRRGRMARYPEFCRHDAEQFAEKVIKAEQAVETS